MADGTAVHALLLGTPSVVIVDAADYRKESAREVRDSILDDGNVPVLATKIDQLREAARIIRQKLADKHGVSFRGKSELSAFWVERSDDGTEVQCRMQMDHFIEADAWADVYDLKTCDSANAAAIQRSVDNYSYDLQAVAYTRGVEAIRAALAGRVQFRWLFCEIVPPYAVRVAEPDGKMRAIARSNWQAAVNTWATCLKSNTWPEYPDEVLRVSPTPWAMNRAVEAGMVKDVEF